MNGLKPMSLKAAFDKIPEGHRKYAAVILKRAMSISVPDITIEGTMPGLDSAFNLLGRATVRKELLKELQKKLNDSMGFNIVRKIEGVHDLIECCEKSVELLGQMVRAILQKEIPHVKPNSESVDVPVGLQSK